MRRACSPPRAFWRDLVSFTWNITTVEGPSGVADLLGGTLENTDPTGFAFTEEPTEADGITTGWLEFETAVGRGSGLVRLKDEDGELKAWTMLTTLDELKGHEEPRDERRPHGTEHGVRRDRVTWTETRQAEAEELGRTIQPYVVVVGGGQGGIALGARLRQLGVSHVMIDRFPRPGDQWRGRYKSLCLHDPVWYDHLPYLPFPRNWPVFSPKDKIGDWLEMYTRVMEINYWSSTTCRSATYDEAAKQWTVVVDRDGEELLGEEVAAKVGKVWGLGSDTTKDPGPWEGEQRNMWKPTRQPGLWLHGGNLHQSRQYSQYLALQLKARQEVIPTPVYGLQEVHHLA